MDSSLSAPPSFWLLDMGVLERDGGLGPGGPVMGIGCWALRALSPTSIAPPWVISAPPGPKGDTKEALGLKKGTVVGALFMGVGATAEPSWPRGEGLIWGNM